LCTLLGAVDEQGRLSALGRSMLRFPLHPRLARVLLEAHERGCGERGCTLAALLSERDIVRSSRAHFDARARDVEVGPSDALDRLERFERAEAERLDAGRLRVLDLDVNAVRGVARTRDRLVRTLSAGPDVRDADEPLLLALLAGFGDRVAKRRKPGGAELVLAAGGSATQAESSVARDAELLVVVDAREQPPRGVVAHTCSAIEPEWLLELFPSRVEDRAELRFDPQSERVEQRHVLRYDGLVLDESRATHPEGPEVERALYEAALARGLDAWGDAEALDGFERRASFAAVASPNVRALTEDARQRALLNACAGKHSFAELRQTGLLPWLRGLLEPAELAAVERVAPEQISLGSGRRLAVHYEKDRPPWVQSRMQDFFGLRTGPTLGDRPLVLHLLAPNQRAVQVTTDLAGFWQRHYPEQRRQLMRRYPKHFWPEDPREAEPPPPRNRPPRQH
ncbi:MAG: ATP-dependent helicase C-terminal domain-containing protein, partial [Polyangiales bacterium]